MGMGPHIFLLKKGDIKENSPKTRPFHHSLFIFYLPLISIKNKIYCQNLKKMRACLVVIFYVWKIGVRNLSKFIENIIHPPFLFLVSKFVYYNNNNNNNNKEIIRRKIKY